MEEWVLEEPVWGDLKLSKKGQLNFTFFKAKILPRKETSRGTEHTIKRGFSWIKKIPMGEIGSKGEQKCLKICIIWVSALIKLTFADRIQKIFWISYYQFLARTKPIFLAFELFHFSFKPKVISQWLRTKTLTKDAWGISKNLEKSNPHEIQSYPHSY